MRGMPPRVTLLLGKPPKPGTLLADVAAGLTAHGCAVTVRLPHEERVDPAELDAADLLVHRGLRSEVAPLLAGVHHRGVDLCNPWPGDRLLRDRLAVAGGTRRRPRPAATRRHGRAVAGGGRP